MTKKALKTTRLVPLDELARRKPGKWAEAKASPHARGTGANRVWDVPHVVTEFALKPASVKQPCKRGEGRKAGRNLKLRDCHVELVMNEGTFLRLCLGEKKPGPLIPIASPAEATQLSKQLCACIAKRGVKHRKACALEVAPNAPLGAARHRRRRRR